MESSATLEHARWKGTSTFRVLSYYFSVRWTWTEGGAYLTRVLGRFMVEPDPSEERNPPTPGLPARYSLVARGRGRARTYALFYADRPTYSSAEPGHVIDSLLWHVNSETVRRTGDFLLIHAGALTTPRGAGLLITGGSGSGKTTLTAALVRSGFGYLSDEAGAIDPVTHRLYPYAKALSVKTDLPDVFPAGSAEDRLLGAQRHVLPEEIRPGCVAGPAELGFVIAHRYEPGAVTALTPISRAAGVVELSRNALNMQTYGERALILLAEAARAARHYALTSGSLDGAVSSVRQVTEVASP